MGDEGGGVQLWGGLVAMRRGPHGEGCTLLGEAPGPGAMQMKDKTHKPQDGDIMHFRFDV